MRPLRLIAGHGLVGLMTAQSLCESIFWIAKRRGWPENGVDGVSDSPTAERMCITSFLALLCKPFFGSFLHLPTVGLRIDQKEMLADCRGQ